MDRQGLEMCLDLKFFLKAIIHARHIPGIPYDCSRQYPTFLLIVSSSENMVENILQFYVPQTVKTQSSSALQKDKNLRNITHCSPDSKTYLMTRASWSTWAISGVEWMISDNYFADILIYKSFYDFMKRMILSQRVSDK